MNTNLDLILSNNIKISYRLGDKINTPICDFMNNCYYTCKPNFDGTNNIDSIDENIMNYTSNNLVLNNDKIRLILYNMFREKYFYYINDVKNHFKFFNISNINIENAIQNIVKNSSIIFKDKYDNPGNIIKFKDLLIFQPLNLNDKNESLFSRMNNYITAPDHITYQPNNNFDQNINSQDKKIDISSKKKTQIDDKKDDSESSSDSKSDSSSDSSSDSDSDTLLDSKLDEKILEFDIIKKKIKELKNKFENILNKDEDNIDNDYKNIKNVYYYLSNYIYKDLLDNIILHFLIENEYYNNYFDLVKYLFNNSELNDIEFKIKEYFLKKLYNINDKKYLIVPNKNNIDIYLFDNFNFTLAEHEDIKELNSYIQELKNSYIFNKIIGFMDYFNDEYIFKTIDIYNLRSSGGRCKIITKTLVSSQINELIKDQDYYNDINKSLDKFHRDSLCIIQELLLRIFQFSNKDNKIWFMNFENSVIFNLKKYKLQN